jgi:hypothetical protein
MGIKLGPKPPPPQRTAYRRVEGVFEQKAEENIWTLDRGKPEVWRKFHNEELYNS